MIKNRGRHNKLKFEVKFTGLRFVYIPNKQDVHGVQAALVNRYLIIRHTPLPRRLVLECTSTKYLNTGIVDRQVVSKD